MLTEDDARRIAKAAAREAVQETLLALGFDVAHPLAAQEQMAMLRSLVEDEEWLADRVYLRTARKLSESRAVKITVAAIGAVIVFVSAMFTLGLRHWIANAPPPP